MKLTPNPNSNDGQVDSRLEMVASTDGRLAGRVQRVSPQLFVNFQTLLGQAIAKHQAQSLSFQSRTGMVIIRGSKGPKTSYESE